MIDLVVCEDALANGDMAGELCQMDDSGGACEGGGVKDRQVELRLLSGIVLQG